MSKQLPSWIKHDTADAYNYAFTFLYCKLPRDVRDLVDKAKADDAIYASISKNTDYASRIANEFFKEVRRMAQYEKSQEDLKALERREKMEGIHPSQQKKPEIPKIEEPKAEPPIVNGAQQGESQNPSGDEKQEGNAS